MEREGDACRTLRWPERCTRLRFHLTLPHMYCPEQIWMWGEPWGDFSMNIDREPRRIDSTGDFVDIACGAFHNLALNASGCVVWAAWGLAASLGRRRVAARSAVELRWTTATSGVPDVPALLTCLATCCCVPALLQ